MHPDGARFFSDLGTFPQTREGSLNHRSDNRRAPLPNGRRRRLIGRRHRDEIRVRGSTPPLIHLICRQPGTTSIKLSGRRQGRLEYAGPPVTPHISPKIRGLPNSSGQPGPAIKLQMVDGQNIDLKNLYGTKPVYLKLWATYCIPCRVQMPGFEKIYETYGDRIEVIAVNAGVGDDAAKVRAFAKKATMRMPSAIDDGALGAWIKLQETFCTSSLDEMDAFSTQVIRMGRSWTLR